jgi:iron(III) transport system substrate-binding protein
MKKEFDAKFPNINLNYVRLSAGEALTRVRNEKANPQFDIMYGGPNTTYISAKKEGLLEAYKSPNVGNLMDPKLMLDSDPVPTWAGIYMGSIGFATNENYLKANPNFKAPTSFDDLIKPEMKGLISIAHPASSGTAYTFMCSALQLKGEKAGWEYMTKFAQNVSIWWKSGIGPIQSAGKGETQVGVVFSHDIIAGIESGQPLKLTFPTEGTGYEVGGMGIIKGAKNPETAKAFYDWLLEPATQELPPKYKAYQGPTVKGAKASKPELLQVKFMNYDFDYCGTNQKAFVDKFSNEIAAASLAK